MEIILFGKVVKLHGYKGQVKVNAKFDSDFNLSDVKNVYLDDGSEFEVEKISKLNDGVLLTLASGTLELATSLVGKNIYIDRKLVQNKILIEDLKNSFVYFEDGQIVGKIVDIQDYGAAEVFELEKVNGKKVLFPNVKGLMIRFDYREKKLVVSKKRFGEVADEN